MSNSDISRRNVFQILGAAPAMAAMAAEVETPKPAAHAPFQRKVFNDHQWRTVHVLCDLIIPADEKSGSATQAGVPEFIDDWLDFRKQQDGNENFAAQILGGLMWLDLESKRLFQTDFAASTAANQKQILDRIAWPERAAAADRPWVSFFNKYRDLTVSGFFSSKMGIADLPYLGNRAVAVWKGADPQVWAIIEDRMKNGYKGLGGEVKSLV
jgi:hypothetical protein